MVIFLINVTLFIVYILLTLMFNNMNFAWWLHLVLGCGMCLIIIFANVFLSYAKD